LCRELRSSASTCRILTIPDIIDVIASEVREMSAAYDFVFTSGGIGPTHDDLTMDGVAKAFGLPIEVNESVVARIERAVGQPANASQRKMAALPAGALLIDAGDLWFPVVVIGNVHVFPGIPELLQKKFESIRARFQGVPFVLRRVYVRSRESDIADDLNAVLEAYPELMLGSYPRIRETEYHVLLTLESRDAEYLERALGALLARLPAEAVHKVE
jgi:molybdopterin-biosynthesis enzyme MoeA-like protein